MNLRGELSPAFEREQYHYAIGILWVAGRAQNGGNT